MFAVRSIRGNLMRTLLLLICLFGGELASAHDALTDVLSRIQSESDLPGFAVAIVKSGHVAYESGFGYANVKSRKPYTAQTIQPVGSVSKTFIGLAVMKAVERGQCSLDADVNEYLPFRVVNARHPDQIITLRRLATHTSGIVDDENAYFDGYTIGTQPREGYDAFLRDYLSPSGKLYKPANFSDAEGVRIYSNIGATLAAYVVERCTHTSFAEFTRQQLFEPLGLQSAHWLPSAEYSANYATLYQIHKPDERYFDEFVRSDKSIRPYTLTTYPDGGLRISAADLGKYLLAMIEGESGMSGVLDKQSFRELFAPQFSKDRIPRGLESDETNSGIFWTYGRRGDIRHTGSDPGVFAMVSFDPRNHAGYALLANAQIEGEDNEKTLKSIRAITGAIRGFIAAPQK
jgi:CubicO group peptidase (beta-lactamase class C family)